MLDMGFEPQIRDIVHWKVREPQGKRLRPVFYPVSKAGETLRQITTYNPHPAQPTPGVTLPVL